MTYVSVSTRRRGIVYGIRVRHPDTGAVVLGYVGKTRQALLAREGQHRVDQPWADTIVGQAFILARGRWTDAELADAETAHIMQLRPLYNHDDNLGNPGRIPIWRAREQRAARDAAAGRRPWSVPVQRGRTFPKPAPVRLRPRQVRALTAVVFAVVLWAGLSWASGRPLLSAAVVAGVGLLGSRRRKRRRRRR